MHIEEIPLGLQIGSQCPVLIGRQVSQARLVMNQAFADIVQLYGNNSTARCRMADVLTPTTSNGQM